MLFKFQIFTLQSDETNGVSDQADGISTRTSNIKVGSRKDITSTRDDVRQFLSNADAVSVSSTIVTPGDLITTDTKWMKGDGTHMTRASKQALLTSTLCGYLQRTNKLLTVHPLHTRYLGAVGDLVVGRITAVQSKRWRVDVNAHQDAQLALSAVNFPGGVQRRRLDEDALQMRFMFSVGDMLVAEVQSVSNDGCVQLHSRSLKYGKLRNGTLCRVPSSLVVRCKSQFLRLPWGVDVVLGLNGSIWVQLGSKKDAGEDHVARAITGDDWLQEESADPNQLYSNTNADITADERERISRTANCINALAETSTVIEENILKFLYETSIQPRPLEEAQDSSHVVPGKDFLVYGASDVLRSRIMHKLVKEAKEKAMAHIMYVD